MDSARWNTVQRLFEAALDQPPAQRDAYLREACADDESLYQDVHSLLNADKNSHSILEGSAVGAAGLPQELSIAGKRVGVYRIVKQIGAVYLAEDEALGRKNEADAYKAMIPSRR